MKIVLQCLAIGVAGFAGAIARFLVGICVNQWYPGRFPLATLVINISGSFILGWFVAYTAQRASVSETTRLAIGAGFVGAYTTFSTYMLESNALIENKAWIEAMINLIGSLVLGLIAVRLGLVMGRRV